MSRPEVTLTRTELLARRVTESIAVRQTLLEDSEAATALGAVVEAMVGSISAGGKVLLCGNGGSAADAQHLAAELVGRFRLDRQPFPAIALADNVAALTAISNDYRYEDAYARAVHALGKPGDILIGLSTSGESLNIVQALKAGAHVGLVTVALVGEEGSSMEAAAEHVIRAPAPSTASIQELHKLLGHVIFELVELELCAL